MRSSDFYNGLLGESSRKIIGVLDKTISMNFITLNYADTLERMLSARQSMIQRGIQLSQIHHTHGTLSEYITMGVSNE